MTHHVNWILGVVFLAISAFVFIYCGSRGQLDTTFIAIGGFAAFLGVLNILHYFKAKRAAKLKEEISGPQGTGKGESQP